MTTNSSVKKPTPSHAASSRGGRALRKSHRVATNFAEFLGTTQSIPITHMNLDDVITTLSAAHLQGRHFAVVSKPSGRRDAETKRRMLDKAYATTVLEYFPGLDATPPRIIRTAHKKPLRYILLEIEAHSNGHVAALKRSQPFVPPQASEQANAHKPSL